MLGSKEPITLDNACHEDWSVQILCTGTAYPAQRRLCVVGCCLGGHWWRPPADFTDTMVLLVLMPKKVEKKKVERLTTASLIFLINKVKSIPGTQVGTGKLWIYIQLL